MSTRIVPIVDYSDGDPTHRPSNPEWVLIDRPTIYLEKLAVGWLSYKGENISRSITYRLDDLPYGYKLYEKPRKSGVAGAKMSDKRLFGSPNHKYFDSPNRFLPHLIHMMNRGLPAMCPCTVCAAPKGSAALPMRGAVGAGAPSVPEKGRPGRKPGFKPAFKSGLNAAPKQPAPPPTPAYKDEEQTPDTLRILIDRLKREGKLDTEFREDMSMDWQAERKTLPRMLDNLASNPSFVPRVGEVVLYIRSLDQNSSVCREDDSGCYKLYDETTDQFHGFPEWEAGVVAQASEQTSLADILDASNKTKNLSLEKGFRIEPLPRSGQKEKGLSKQFKYVPLHWMRPFVFWKAFIYGIPEERWHPTINNALAVMASFSLAERHSFSGKWPKANVNCKGVYVGAELWVTGDAVRILPDEGSEEIIDILHITSVVLQLSNLDKATENDEDDRHPYNTAIHLYGKLYTVDPRRAWNGEAQPLSKQEEATLPPGTKGYKLYQRHDPRKSVRVPLTKVLGRCFEAESVQLWFPTSTGAASEEELLSLGLSGHEQARDYAKKNDSRILPDKKLFWADNRGEALDIAELNGVLLSKHDPERDEDKLDDWSAATKMLSSVAGNFDKYKLVQKAQQSALDTALPSAEGGEQSLEPRRSESIGDPSDTRPGLRLPSATPSDELEDESEEELKITAQFGIGGQQAERKRSRSVAEMDEEEGVKGVARGLVAPVAKASSALASALGVSREHEAKRARTTHSSSDT